MYWEIAMRSSRRLSHEWETIRELWRDEQALQFEKTFLKDMEASLKHIEDGFRQFLEVAERR